MYYVIIVNCLSGSKISMVRTHSSHYYQHAVMHFIIADNTFVTIICY